MECCAKRLDLLEQLVSQLLACANRYGRNVINRLVGVDLNALAAGIGEGVDHVGLDLEQTQLKSLKKARRAGSHNDGIGFDGAIVLGCGVDHFLIQLRFHVFLTCFLNGSGMDRWRANFSAHQLSQLPGLVFPLLGIRQGVLALGDGFPTCGTAQLSIEFDELQLIGWHIFFGRDGIDRAFRNAQGAINATVGAVCPGGGRGQASRQGGRRGTLARQPDLLPCCTACGQGIIGAPS